MNPTVAYDANGILWLSYRADDNGNGISLVVDKSCDGGKTWSGAVPVSAKGNLNDLKWPGFAMTPGDAPHLLGWATDHISAFSLTGD